MAQSHLSTLLSLRRWKLGAVVAVSLLASSHVTAIAQETDLRDQRQQKLEEFFQSYSCPAPYHVAEYLRAADDYDIDYRLLPAISILESTCGRYQRLNNRWGWDSARQGFSSFRAGLEYIAHQLAAGRYYKNKTLEEKVRMYNPNPRYAKLINVLMRKIENQNPVEMHADAAAPRASYPTLTLEARIPERGD